MRGYSLGFFQKRADCADSTIYPFSIKQMVQLSFSKSALSCVVTITINFYTASFSIFSATKFVSNGSSAEVGSSRHITNGCNATARAIFWPSESLLIVKFSSSIRSYFINNFFWNNYFWDNFTIFPILKSIIG